MASAADEQRIRALEVQNADLRQRIDALQAQVYPPPKPAAPLVEDDGPRVFFPRSTSIAMPTIAEFEQLLIIVGRAYPKIVPAFDRHGDRMEFFNGFSASFERISHLRRTVDQNGTQVVNVKYDVRYWADEAYRWLNARGTPAETMNGSFFAAVIAADVPFSLANREAGISAHVGLSYDGLTASTAAWRRVLKSGEPRAPSAGPQPLRQNHRVAEVRIV